MRLSIEFGPTVAVVDVLLFLGDAAAEMCQFALK